MKHEHSQIVCHGVSLLFLHKQGSEVELLAVGGGGTPLLLLLIVHRDYARGMPHAGESLRRDAEALSEALRAQLAPQLVRDSHL